MEINDIKTLERHFATFSERSEEVRNKNYPEVYASDVKIYDPHFVVEGYGELNNVISSLHNRFPDYCFTLRKPIEQHHNVARLYWQLGSVEKPDVQTGMDVMIIENGKIQTLVIFIDPEKK